MPTEPVAESPLATALSQLRTAVDYLELSESEWATLSTARRVLEVAVPLRRDDERVEMLSLIHISEPTRPY